MVVLIGVIVSVMCVFLLRMYTLAAVSPDERAVADADSMTYQTTVEGARGCILDRNGNVLVSNRATYNIVIINYVLANTGAPNENILKLLQMCQQLGIECQSHFPVTKTKPYEYDMQSLNTTWQNYFRMFLNNRDYDLDISASTLMRNLREAYRIPNDWDADDVYNVILSDHKLKLKDSEVAVTNTKESVQDQIQSVIDDLQQIILVMILLGAVLCVAAVYLTVNMMVEENGNTISMLKIFGYRKGEINSMVLSANHILVPLSLVISIPLGILAGDLFYTMMIDNLSAYIEAVISVKSSVLCAALVVVSYLLSLTLLKRKVFRVNMVECLKDNRA